MYLYIVTTMGKNVAIIKEFDFEVTATDLPGTRLELRSDRNFNIDCNSRRADRVNNFVVNNFVVDRIPGNTSTDACVNGLNNGRAWHASVRGACRIRKVNDKLLSHGHLRWARMRH